MSRKDPGPPADPWDVGGIESLAPDPESVAAARKVLAKGEFGTVESTADGRGWWVVCRGLTDTYQVSVRRDPGAGVEARCTCPSRKRPCKHALALLLYLAAHPDARVEPAAAAAKPVVDLDSLVRAVFASPNDDLPRLVLADWLDEQGQPERAGLIRAQCDPNRKPGRTLSAEEKARVAAVRPLVEPFPDGVTGEFRRGFLALSADWSLGHPDNWPPRFLQLFRDGWVECVALRTADGLRPEHFPLLVQARDVDLSRGRIARERLVAVAADLRPGVNGSRLREVRVHPLDRERYDDLVKAMDAEADLPAALAASHPLTGHPTADGTGGVREFSDLTPTRFRLLARTGQLEGERNLLLYGPIGDGGAATLAATPRLGDLEALSMASSGLTADGLGTLVEAGLTARLRRLTVTGSAVGDDGAAALARGRFPLLEALDLSSAGLTDDGARALAAAQFPRLTRLDLLNNRLTSAGAAALLGAERLRGVRFCNLRGNAVPVTDWFPLVLGAVPRAELSVAFAAGAVSVSRAGGVGPRSRVAVVVTGDREPAPRLFDRWTEAGGVGTVVALTVGDFRFDATTVNRLADALAARPVRELTLNKARLRNDAAAALAARLPDLGLESLNLEGNEIGKAGAVALAGSPGLATVRTLVLDGNPIRPSGVAAVLASPHLTAARRVVVPGDDLDPTQRRDLRATAPAGAEVVFA